MEKKILVTLRQLERQEEIYSSDLQSYENSPPDTIKNNYTIGQKPADFSPERKFWRITNIEEVP